jgi:hypothetical protein
MAASHCERLLRRTFTLIASLLLLLASSAFLYFSSTQSALAGNNTDTVVCVGAVTRVSTKTCTLLRRMLQCTLSYFNDVCVLTILQDMASQSIGQLSCYCASLPSASILTGKEPLCWDWAKKQAISAAIQNVAALVVILVNIGLEIVLAFLSAFEAHPSVDRADLSFAQRLFAVSFVNTALLPLAVTAKTPGIPSSGTQYDDLNKNHNTTEPIR